MGVRQPEAPAPRAKPPSLAMALTWLCEPAAASSLARGRVDASPATRLPPTSPLPRPTRPARPAPLPRRLEPRRGVPHARLRDVTFRWLDGGGDGGGELHRLVEERGVRLDAGRGPLADGSASLDAEAMLPLLPLTSPAVAHRARLPLPAASAPPPAAPPFVAAASPPAADAASLPPRSGKAPRLEGSPREGSPRGPRLSAWPAGTRSSARAAQRWAGPDRPRPAPGPDVGSLLDGPVACMAVDSDTGRFAVRGKRQEERD